MLRRLPLDWIERRLQADPKGTAALAVRLLREYAPRYWKRYALTIVFDAIAAGCTALTAFLIAHVVNAIYADRNFPAVIAVCAVFFILMTAKGLALYAQAIILAQINNAITAENQRRIFKKLLHESLDYFADRHSTEFVAQITYSAAAAGSMLALLVTSLAGDSLTLVGLVTVMVVQDPVITLFALVAIPAATFLIRDVVLRIREVAGRQYAALTGIMESIQETVRGLRTIKAFTLEGVMERRVDGQTRESQAAADRLAGLSNLSTPLMEALGGVAVGLLALYVGYRVIYGGAKAGELVSCIAAFLLAYEPIKRLTRLNVSLNSVMFGVQTFYALVDAPPAEAEDGGKPHLSLSQGRIEFADVDFAYSSGVPVLRRMTLVAEPGQVTALVGPSGGGKSTVLNLILHLYEAGAGQISVDGQDVALVSRASLRRQIAYVGQDVFLFRGTIRENIGFGRPDATEQEIVAAATAAHAHEFITTFPKGYDTPVGEHGTQLSTGQRQRVSIARALLKDAPLILLDEPTAALDSESERHVQDAMARLCRERTTMVIAHRLQTIMHADRILFVEHGSVAESGSHAELLRRGGRYAAFYRLQFDEQPARRRAAIQALASSQ
jgi:subfamily B ATP-binding cassette protein MsbA